MREERRVAPGVAGPADQHHAGAALAADDEAALVQPRHDQHGARLVHQLSRVAERLVVPQVVDRLACAIDRHLLVGLGPRGQGSEQHEPQERQTPEPCTSVHCRPRLIVRRQGAAPIGRLCGPDRVGQSHSIEGGVLRGRRHSGSREHRIDRACQTVPPRRQPQPEHRFEPVAVQAGIGRPLRPRGPLAGGDRIDRRDRPTVPDGLLERRNRQVVPGRPARARGVVKHRKSDPASRRSRCVRRSSGSPRRDRARWSGNPSGRPPRATGPFAGRRSAWCGRNSCRSANRPTRSAARSRANSRPAPPGRRRACSRRTRPAAPSDRFRHTARPSARRTRSRWRCGSAESRPPRTVAPVPPARRDWRGRRHRHRPPPHRPRCRPPR